jgi:hypothetical protein
MFSGIWESERETFKREMIEHVRNSTGRQSIADWQGRNTDKELGCSSVV